MSPITSTVRTILAGMHHERQAQMMAPYPDRRARAAPATATRNKRDDALDDDDDSQEDDAPARSEEQRFRAVAAIRAFRGDERLSLAYLATRHNPYSDADDLIERYADHDGNEYWVDAQNDILIHMGPRADSDPKAYATGSDERLPVAVLRERAVAIAVTTAPGFAARKHSLHPLEDNRRRELYFFRWDDFSTPLRESQPAPYLQVGLYADGRIASYTNTLN